MHPYPHQYSVVATGAATGTTTLEAGGLPPLQIAAPPQFDGPGGQWSPEALLTAAVAGCFILTFRSLARSRGLSWTRLSCHVQGTLDRAGGVSRFTAFDVHANLCLETPGDADTARRLLEQAEHGCLIANSLRAERTLDVQITCQSA